MEILLFFGRFHPLLVHLPIGFLVIAFLLEVFSRKPRYAGFQPAVAFVLLLGAGSAILSAGLGYLLSLAGDYDGAVLGRHQWLGIGVAAAAISSLVLKMRLRRRPSRLTDRGYVMALVLTMCFLMGTGHYGGSLTHGSDYLTTYLPAPLRELPGMPAAANNKLRPIANLPEALVYGDIIQPIFDARCAGCHNATKKKGGLSLAGHGGLAAGGKGGAVVLAGQAGASEIYKRLLLPPENKHAMPPKGKEPLTESELQLIAWWINNGADATKKVKQMPLNPAVRLALANRVAAPAPALNPVFTRREAPAPAAAIAAATQAGFQVIPWSAGQPYLRVGRRAGAPAPKSLAALRPLARQIVALDLAGSPLSDSLRAALGSFPHLTRLHLENTGTSDAGLAPLASMPYLEYLNLYGNPVTDKGLAALAGLRHLRRLYVWQTRVTATGMAGLQKKLPQLVIYAGLPVAPLARESKPVVREKAGL
jgi:uncharacterized membrane protein/mono/diheme cytochrome c family protein